MKQQQIFSIIRMLLLALILSPFMAVQSSAYNFQVDGIYYNISSYPDKTVSVTYEGASTSKSYWGNFVIPSSVTYLGTTYFVTSIGDGAFYGCSGLTSVTIPNSVTSIGDYAFYNCSHLTGVTLLANVTSIGESTFHGCSSLTDITIPDGVTSIGERAFSGCSGLTSVTIPTSVTSIGSYAFNGCSRLTSVTIPDGVTSIGNGAFNGCRGLTSVTIPNSVTSIGSIAFYGCRGLTSVTIPDGVTSIGRSAFYGCRGLTSVTIGSGVTSIGNYAFNSCSDLKEIISQNVNAPHCWPVAFDYVHKSDCIVYVPKGSIPSYANADEWKEFFNIKEYPGDTTGVIATSGEESTVNIIYDMSGRKVAASDVKALPKGVYIINNKKVAVK